MPAIIKNPPLSGLPDTRVENSISPLAFGMSAIIDYERQQMLVGREIPEEPANVVLPLRFNRLAMVRGVVNQDHPKSFIVDTGGEGDLDQPRHGEHPRDGARAPHPAAGGTGTLGLGHGRLPGYRGVHLAFDRIQYENFSVVVLNLHRPSALLGFHIGGIVGPPFPEQLPRRARPAALHAPPHRDLIVASHGTGTRGPARPTDGQRYAVACRR